MSAFPTDEMTLRLLIEACDINADTGRSHLQDFLQMGTRVKSRTQLDYGYPPVYEVEYEKGAGPWSEQLVIQALATEILRLRGEL